MAVMRQGELVEIGASDQICDAPRHPYTAELLAAVPRTPTPPRQAARSGRGRPRLN
ncbi:MAG: hypothetical protein R3C69_14930 [Geminicoccaceae bacterium]